MGIKSNRSYRPNAAGGGTISGGVSDHGNLSNIEGDGEKHISDAQLAYIRSQLYQPPTLDLTPRRRLQKLEVGESYTVNRSFNISIGNIGNLLNDEFEIAGPDGNYSTVPAGTSSFAVNHTTSRSTPGRFNYLQVRIRRSDNGSVQDTDRAFAQWYYRTYWGQLPVGQNVEYITTAAQIFSLSDSLLANNYLGIRNFIGSNGGYHFLARPVGITPHNESEVVGSPGTGVLKPQSMAQYGDAPSDIVTVPDNGFGESIDYQIWRSQYVQSKPLTIKFT
mgnify:CR=1 FL=1